MSVVDLVVVGAGCFGLIAASTWLELNPNGRVVIVERGPDLGGVWSKSRIHPTLMTQCPLGMFEYSCYPMPKLPRNETFHDFFPGSHVVSYLDSFSTHKSYGGKTIKDRITFNNSARQITKIANLWFVETTSGETFTCKKLIIATGLTSTPNIPSFPSKGFTPETIHSRDLATKTSFLSSPAIKSAVVLGGAKSAFDAVSLLHSLGKSVTWIIRTSGQGPALVLAPHAPWPLSNSHEIISTRLVAKMSPCIFEPLDNWGKFFHGNVVGRWMVDKIWAGVNSTWTCAGAYKRDKNLRDLKPVRPLFWTSDGIAVYNNKEMWKSISKATILRDEVTELEGKEVVLKSGKRIGCDVLVAATGWLNGYPMFEDGFAKELGLPVNTGQIEDDPKWKQRLQSADAKVVKTFPRLAKQPTYPDRKPKSTPSYLYRSMIPTQTNGDSSIAFVGAIGTSQSLVVAEIQALWVAASFSGKMPLPTKDEMEDETALALAWRRRRYLGDGYTFVLEHLQYMSMLLRDLGLNDRRKGGGWKEILLPYTSVDYKGFLDEWKDRHGVEDGGEVEAK